MVPLFDTHQHLIFPDRQRYAWAADAPALAGRAFTLDDYRALTAGAGVAGTLFMEVDAEDGRSEARMVAGLAREPGSGILGLVAACRPEEDAGFAAWLDEGPGLGVVGYRRILHETGDEVSRSETFRANVRAIGARGLPFDMCFLARQLPVALELARACPETLLVLDHCGVPDIAGGGFEPWREGIAALAAMPNVVAKLSGVFAYCAPGTASLGTVRPWVEAVIAAFGPGRCLWGSDWPVVNVRGGDLPGWIAAFRAILAGYSAEEQAAMAHRTAERVYRVRLARLAGLARPLAAGRLAAMRSARCAHGFLAGFPPVGGKLLSRLANLYESLAGRGAAAVGARGPVCIAARQRLGGRGRGEGVAWRSSRS